MTFKSKWDIQDLGRNGADRFIKELVRLDRANRRKRRALRQMNKSIQRNLAYIDELEDTIIDLQNQLDSEVDNELIARHNELEAELWEGW